MNLGTSLAEAVPGLDRAIGRHMELAFRNASTGPDIVREPAFMRWMSGEAHPLGNLAILSAPVQFMAARRAVEPLIATTRPSAVVFPGLDVPADVAAFLDEHGYTTHGRIPAMAVDIARLQPTALPPGYEFVRVGSGADGEEWVRQFAAGYGLPLGVARYFSPVALGAGTAPDAPVQFFAVRKGSAIVGTSMCYLQDGMAGIYSVATLPGERRKGLGEHATAEPLRLAARLGYRVGVLQSSEAGYGVYRKLGFQEFGGVPIFIRMPA